MHVSREMGIVLYRGWSKSKCLELRRAMKSVLKDLIEDFEYPNWGILLNNSMIASGFVALP